jgi:hypothetical protein
MASGGAIGCLRGVLKKAPKIIRDVFGLQDRLREYEDTIYGARENISRFRKMIEEEQQILDQAQSELLQNGCDRS